MKKFRVTSIVTLDNDNEELIAKSHDTPENYIQTELVGWAGQSFADVDVVKIEKIDEEPREEVITN